MEKNSLAILFFSRSATAEAYQKKWTQNKGQDQVIASSLRSHSLSCLAKTDIPVFEFSEKEQVGETFADRLHNAFDKVFNHGFSHVIALGSDLPSIAELNWEIIQKKLLTHGVLIGPDLRGGVYLLGLDRDAFHKSDFSKLSWQSKNLLSTIVQNFPKAAMLEKRADLNNKYDIRSALRSGLRLIRCIFDSINRRSRPFHILIQTYAEVLVTLNLMRGPPKVIAS